MKQYVVDAFAEKVFTGNPAAVIVRDEWLDDDTMQKIAIENNLSETAFTVKEGDKYHLRWFTPGGEVDLCGHATLGTSYVLFNYYEKDAKEITFTSLSGDLFVKRIDDLYEIDLPAYELKKQPVTQEIIDALGDTPDEVYYGEDMLCVFEDPEKVRRMNPDQAKVKELFGVACHVTAPGGEFDCISRSFCPKSNVAEDPVCGRGHCHVVPYWAERLGKNKIYAYQASPRGGILHCTLENGRCRLAGPVTLFSEDNVHFGD